MRLSELIGEKAGRHGALEIEGLTADSREVGPGFLFAAFAGEKTDGTRFVADAVRRGAVAVLAERPLEAAVPVFVGEDARRCLALIAARFFATQPRTVVAVTGTSGKSSTVWFLRQLWSALGHKAASLGTLGIHTAGGHRGGSLTTPDPVALQRTVAELAREGISHLALEASSHGLAQRRLDGLRFTAGIFTNLGHDHLDYHRDKADYLDAKLRLFRTLLERGAPAVINAESDVAPAVMAAARERGLEVVSYGRGEADLRFRIVDASLSGQSVEFSWKGQRDMVRLPLVGAFQAENAAAALALCLSLGSDLRGCLAALSELEGAPGRLQLAGFADGAAAFVDYAHKPDALRAVLETLRPHVAGRIVTVVGCGGDRDRLKRPVMGRIAAELSDIAIVTDDNPRSENPARIRAEIMVDCPGGIEIGDRRRAIRHAVALLRAGDVALIAGKGHETGQIIGDRVLPFDDLAETQAALKERAERA